jgi:hypothetical protein
MNAFRDWKYRTEIAAEQPGPDRGRRALCGLSSAQVIQCPSVIAQGVEKPDIFNGMRALAAPPRLLWL